MPRALAAAVSKACRQRVAAACLVLGSGLQCVPTAAWADPNDYVLTLDFTGGEREVETKIGAGSSARSGAPAAEAAAFGWGTGVSDAWFTEAYVQFANGASGTGGGGLDGVSWENVIRFSEPGRWPVDLGAALEIERPRGGSQGWKLTVGPLLQKDFDQLQLNANLMLSRSIGGAAHEPTQMSYQFQLRYRNDPRLEIGMQALGDVGAWNHWGAPSGPAHRAGPAIFGSRKLGPGRGISYNAALLFGLSRGAADASVRAQIEYEY